VNQKKIISTYTTGNKEIDRKVEELLEAWGVEFDTTQYAEMIVSILKMAQEKPHTRDVRLYNRALKELRYANKVFVPYQGVKKISIFGSARTRPESAEFIAAKDFARKMMEAGYMIITGGGDGIMGAAQAGAGKERSFGLNISLPFEQRANETIHGDPKLVSFKYFFTRKLNFVKESDAIALFPGGFGTMDEGFEALTLMQTGKSRMLPVVLVDAPGGNFWRTFDRYLREHLLMDGWISSHDFNLYKITNNLDEAVQEVMDFYYNFHSYRFVGEQLVIRLKREVPPGALGKIQRDFSDIIRGECRMCTALPEEVNEPEIADLPRLCFTFDRRSYGRFRQLINRINEF
jgi:uncharacterized protein (TIGR00730 family)